MGLAKVKIGGAWVGVLELNLTEWTVAMLRKEIETQSGCVEGLETITLISAGKVLKDGDGTENLSQLGFKNNSKILATRASANHGKLKEEFLAEEERSKRLSRLKFAATSLAQRRVDHASLPIEIFDIELEDQSGQKVQLGSETDQQAITMGLMLHANAKQLIAREKYRDALEVLTMGEEAFSLCNQKLIEMIDNVSILQIDMVWCYFMLRDISWLQVAGQRLAKAREGLERTHDEKPFLLIILQGEGQFLELALYLRLELLEGIVAYHSGQLENCRKALSAAQMKFFQLQVPDGALSLLMGMGYEEVDAKRALRMCNQDVESAVEFLVEERERETPQEDLRHLINILKRKQYGMTPLGKAADLQKLNELVSIGFDTELAAEALRRNENDSHKSLDDLTNQETRDGIQVDIEFRKSKRLRVEEAAGVGQPNENAAAATTGVGNRGLGSEADNGGDVMKHDKEMEDELTRGLEGTDAFSDYDIDVSKEGEAIKEYLFLLSSTDNVPNFSLHR